MKYKGIILFVLIAIAVVLLIFLPEEKMYREIAEVGSKAPAFELKDAEGNLWRMADLKGKVVFINFWATWCTTCKAEMPYKENLYEMMQGKPFQMFGMLYKDDPENLADYYKIQKVSPPTLISPDNEAGRMFGITGVPETFIIDKEGFIRHKLVGPREWDSPEMLALIEELL
jgi:thiol-disulfide isomerase/thioredoxin